MHHQVGRQPVDGLTTRLKTRCYALALIYFCLSPLAAAAENESSAAAGQAARPTGKFWPQWRGPSRNGRVHNAAWPNSIDEDHLTLMWDVDHGPSYSGTIVVGDKVFTTETLDKTTEVVLYLSRKKTNSIIKCHKIH